MRNYIQLGRVKKETWKEEGLFISRWPPFFLKCQTSIVFSTAKTHNTQMKHFGNDNQTRHSIILGESV